MERIPAALALAATLAFGLATAQPLTERYADIGTMIVTTSDHTMFPSEKRAKGHTYEGKAYSADVHYRTGEDSSDINSYQHDYAIMGRYDVKSWWTLKAEGHYVDGTGLLDVPNKQAGYLVGSGPTATEHWYYVVARTTFSF